MPPAPGSSSVKRPPAGPVACDSSRSLLLENEGELAVFPEQTHAAAALLAKPVILRKIGRARAVVAASARPRGLGACRVNQQQRALAKSAENPWAVGVGALSRHETTSFSPPSRTASRDGRPGHPAISFQRRWVGVDPLRLRQGARRTQANLGSDISFLFAWHGSQKLFPLKGGCRSGLRVSGRLCFPDCAVISNRRVE